MTARACIFGLEGTELSPAEAAFFREASPWGFILFARNVEAPDQVRRLTTALREAVGRDAPILIDQEGGRVARLRPPHWHAWSPVLSIFDGADEAAAIEAAELRYRIIAEELWTVGIDVNCMPLLDLPLPDAHEIISDRALGRMPEEVGRRGQAICRGLRAGGVLPVIKHLPGHGRAMTDSHDALPEVVAQLDVLEASDFAAFRPVAEELIGMTAHVVYTALDPERPATHAPAAIRAIREAIGFGGLLLTDDLSMRALSGPMRVRAELSFAAGCDVALHCNGERAEMEAVAEGSPMLAGQPAMRARAAEAARVPGDSGLDIDQAVARYRELLGEDGPRAG